MLEVIDIRYALQSVVILLLELGDVCNNVFLNLHFLEAIRLAIASTIKFDPRRILLLLHLHVYDLINRLITHNHVASISCYGCKIISFSFNSNRLSLIILKLLSIELSLGGVCIGIILQLSLILLLKGLLHQSWWVMWIWLLKITCFDVQSGLRRQVINNSLRCHWWNIIIMFIKLQNIIY